MQNAKYESSPFIDKQKVEYGLPWFNSPMLLNEQCRIDCKHVTRKKQGLSNVKFAMLLGSGVLLLVLVVIAALVISGNNQSLK